MHIIFIMVILLFLIVGYHLLKQIKRAINRKVFEVDKFKNYFEILNQWLIYKNKGKSLVEYFSRNGYKKIAIYGMADLGNRLYEELINTEVEVCYAIEKRTNLRIPNLKLVKLGEAMEPVEIIVVTPTTEYAQIEKEIRKYFNCKIVSLEDVVFDNY